MTSTKSFNELSDLQNFTAQLQEKAPPTSHIYKKTEKNEESNVIPFFLFNNVKLFWNQHPFST